MIPLVFENKLIIKPDVSSSLSDVVDQQPPEVTFDLTRMSIPSKPEIKKPQLFQLYHNQSLPPLWYWFQPPVSNSSEMADKMSGLSASMDEDYFSAAESPQQGRPLTLAFSPKVV